MSGYTVCKYVTAETAKKCLSDRTLYLARPGQLNDTLEARFARASAGAYLDVVESTLAKIASKRGEAPLVFDREALPEFKALNEQENDRFQRFCENIGICSLTSHPNHQAMWAYYGQGGHGLCLELKFSNEVLNDHELLLGPVEYSDQPRVLNRADDLRESLLEMADQNPNASVRELLKLSFETPFRRRMGLRMAQRATSRKHTDWKHENEIRLLGPNGGYPIPILEKVLSKIHFVNSKALALFAPFLREHYPEVPLVYWESDHTGTLKHGRSMELNLIPVD